MKISINSRYIMALGAVCLSLMSVGYLLFAYQTDQDSSPSANETVHQNINISAIYMTVINTGTTPQKLISASVENVDLVSIYRNPRLTAEGATGIVFNPHEQVDLNKDTIFFLLYGVREDLEVADTVDLTLYFDSENEITTTIPVKFAPDTNAPPIVNVIDGFQIINAYAVPTVFGTQNNNSLTTGYDWYLPTGFPLPIVPVDNPMSTAKFQLGRYLFYDTRLSGNNTQACASCHEQELAFTDGLALSSGSTDELLVRNSQSLVNVAYNPTYTWANPILTSIEQQVLIPMFGEFPIELGMTGQELEILDRFREDTLYQGLFAEAFPDDEAPVTINNIQLALASFVRGLISADSAYDQYVFQEDKSALSDSARRGMDLFFGERFECHHCHGGFNFSDSTVHAASVFIETPFHNTGLYNIDGTGAFPPANRGIYEITGEASDMGRFRAPTLRNIELTAPYMHDGSVATLEEVIAFYADGGRVIETGDYAGDGRQNPHKSGFVAGFDITSQETEDLINFLKSLTDDNLLTNPRFSNPFTAVSD